MSLTNPNTPVSQQDLQDFYHKLLPYMGGSGGSSATVLSQTLTAGNTSVTFTNLPTTGNNLVDFFTSTGINYTDIDVSTAGQVTLTFDAQIVDVVVYCKIEEVTV